MPSFFASSTARCSRLRVDHPDGGRRLGEVPDAAERLLELVALAPLDQQLLLRVALRRVVEVDEVELLETVEALVHGLEVGEQTAEPALVDVGLADAGRLLGDGLLGLLLRADEQHRATAGDGLLDEVVGLVDVGQRLLQVDDVDAGALRQDEALDLRVPPAGLVSEMHAAVEQLADGDDGHGRSSSLHPTGGAVAVAAGHAGLRSGPGALRRVRPRDRGTDGRRSRDRAREVTPRTGCGQQSSNSPGRGRAGRPLLPRRRAARQRCGPAALTAPARAGAGSTIGP